MVFQVSLNLPFRFCYESETDSITGGSRHEPHEKAAGVPEGIE